MRCGDKALGAGHLKGYMASLTTRRHLTSLNFFIMKFEGLS